MKYDQALKMRLFKTAADRILCSGKTWQQLAQEHGFASAKLARKEYQKLRAQK